MTVDYSLTLYLNLNLSVQEIISNSMKKVDLNVLAFKPCGHGIGYIVIRASVLAETCYFKKVKFLQNYLVTVFKVIEHS